MKAKKEELMGRSGKIARLPRSIRDELNQRLDDGGLGVQLVAWLNELPEVKEVLAAYFEGRVITEDNLSEWRRGGFLDWRSQRDALAFIADMRSEGNELGKVTVAELAEPLTMALMAHYTAAVNRSNGDDIEEPRERVKRLSKSLRDVVRLRRCELARERTQIQRESLEIKREKTEDGHRKKLMELIHDKRVREKLQPGMSDEERTRRITAILFPDHLAPVPK